MSDFSPAGNPRWSKDGKYVYCLGRDNIWVISPEDRRTRTMTDLSGRRGRLMSLALAVDDRYLYFAWEELLGDLWVMEVVED